MVELPALLPVRSTALLVICPICKHGFNPSGRQKFCSGRCRQRSFYYRFKDANGMRYKQRPKQWPPRYKLGSRTRLVGGVVKRHGRYIAHISVGNNAKQKAYSIKRLGEKAAKLAASLQRMAWVIEFGVWNPWDGDPFEILSYSESFKRNHEYENAVVDDVSSPWIPEREDD